MTIFPLLLLAIAFAADDPVLGPVPEFTRVDKTDPDDSFAWEWTGLDTGGQPSEADRVVYRLFTDGTDERLVVAFPGAIAAGTTKHLVRDVLAAVPPGRYRIGVQLRSPAGLWGPFSENLLIEVVDGTPAPPGRGPAAPIGFRVERGESP